MDQRIVLLSGGVVVKVVVPVAAAVDVPVAAAAAMVVPMVVVVVLLVVEAAGMPISCICLAIQIRNGLWPSLVEYCNPCAAIGPVNASANASWNACFGNSSGSGMPPAKDMISG